MHYVERLLTLLLIVFGTLALCLVMWLLAGASLSDRDPDMCCAQFHEVR